MSTTTGRARVGRVTHGSTVVLSPAVRTRLLICALIVLAAGCGVLAHGISPDLDLGGVAVLTTLALVSVSLPTRGSRGHIGPSLTPVVQIAAIPIGGALAGLIVGAVSHLLIARRQRLASRLFNASMNAVMGAVAGLLYVAVGGVTGQQSGVGPLDVILHLGLPLVLAFLVSTLVNLAVLYLRLGWDRPDSREAFVRAALPGLRGQLPISVLVAFLFAVLWGPGGLQMFAAVLVLGPLAVAHWTLAQDEAERSSQESTVTTLVATFETANPFSVGHPDRVAELSARMAEELGLSPGEKAVLAHAARLHDVGLITASSTRRSAREVDVDYLVEISQHPDVGVEILQEIGFLAPVLPAIRHHHERWDGRGYPSGLAGEEIPLAARIIAVADAFDALTCAPPERQPLTDRRALARLRERAGTHLDPHAVDALGRVLSAGPWAPTMLVRADDARLVNHDDPVVSDLYADWSPEGDEDEPCPDPASAPPASVDSPADPARSPHRAVPLSGET